jgi:hypothetical protein
VIVDHVDHDSPAVTEGRAEALPAAAEMAVGFGKAVQQTMLLQTPADFGGIAFVEPSFDVIAHQGTEAAFRGRVGQKQVCQMVHVGASSGISAGGAQRGRRIN